MRRMTCLIVGLYLLVLSGGVTRADDVKPPDSFFDLTGQAGLPSYLKCDTTVRGGIDGITGGQLNTDDTDFHDKDFTLDVIFQFDDEQNRRFEGVVGIGENGHEGGWLINSLEARLTGNQTKAQAVIKFHHKSEEAKVGALNSDGPHLMRMKKVGNTLTVSVIDKYKGEDPDTFKFTHSSVVADFKKETPFLDDSNSSLYLSGNVHWRAVRLQVAGKTVDGGKRADGDLKPVADDTKFFTMGATSHVPGFLAKPATEAENTSHFTKDGWQMNQIFRTRNHDYLKKDFTLDLVVHADSGERGAFFVGMGENGHDSGNWILNSACATIGGPASEGQLTSTFHDFWGPGNPEFGKLGKGWTGSNLIRMQHHGDTLTFFVCPEFDGKFKPEYMTVMPSLHSQAKFLTDKNAYFFFGDKGTVEKLRLVVDGKSIDPNVLPVGQPDAIAENTPSSPTQTPAQTPEKRTPKTRNTPPARPQKTPTRAPETPKDTTDVPPPPDTRPKLMLASDVHQITPGLGSTILLLEKDSLRRLKADGWTVAETIKLPGVYKLIAERRDYFVAVSDEQKCLDLIDKKTLKVTRSIQMDYHQRYDLALSPFKPICYVTVQKTHGDGFENDILIVDESSGDVREPDGFRGKFVKTSPDGQLLYAAYSEYIPMPGYTNGAPNYIDIDTLYVYDVRTKNPDILAAKEEAGANCFGLAVTPDGKRVSYLSFTGYPLYSKNVAVWDPRDFDKRPVAFATQANKADCKHLAFHPELPFAAACADNGAVVFDLDSGKLQKDRLEIPYAFDGTKVNDLIFSPDGTTLLLDCEQNGDHFLVKIKVKLNADEAETAKKGPPMAKPPAGKTGDDGKISA